MQRSSQSCVVQNDWSWRAHDAQHWLWLFHRFKQVRQLRQIIWHQTNEVTCMCALPCRVTVDWISTGSARCIHCLPLGSQFFADNRILPGSNGRNLCAGIGIFVLCNQLRQSSEFHWKLLDTARSPIHFKHFLFVPLFRASV